MFENLRVHNPVDKTRYMTYIITDDEARTFKHYARKGSVGNLAKILFREESLFSSYSL